jgi:hypothetical protein
VLFPGNKHAMKPICLTIKIKLKKRFKFFLFSATKSTQDQAEDDQGGLGAIQGSEEGPGEAARVRIIIWEGLKIWERDLDTFCFGIIILGDGYFCETS